MRTRLVASYTLERSDVLDAGLLSKVEAKQDCEQSLKKLTIL